MKRTNHVGSRTSFALAAVLASALPAASQVTVEGSQAQAGALVGAAQALKATPAAAAVAAEEPGENHTISASGLDSQADAEAKMNAMIAALKKAGYAAVNSHATAYELQEYGSYTIGGSWAYQYDVTYVGPDSQRLDNSGFSSEADARAEMDSVAAKLGGLVILDETVSAYALPEYGSFTIGGSWAYRYHILYISPKNAAK